jgi:hypothetical protein
MKKIKEDRQTKILIRNASILQNRHDMRIADMNELGESLKLLNAIYVNQLK